MNLSIEKLGNPVLRNVSVDIDKDYSGLSSLIEDMKYTLKYVNGVGLAAPQINLNVNLFVVNVHGNESTFINPRVVNIGDKKIKQEESCLSLPKYTNIVSRYDNVRIQYYDESFNFHDEFYSGLLSRIIQHEYDHLKGILIIDKN